MNKTKRFFVILTIAVILIIIILISGYNNLPLFAHKEGANSRTDLWSDASNVCITLAKDANHYGPKTEWCEVMFKNELADYAEAKTPTHTDSETKTAEDTDAETTDAETKTPAEAAFSRGTERGACANTFTHDGKTFTDECALNNFGAPWYGSARWWCWLSGTDNLQALAGGEPQQWNSYLWLFVSKYLLNRSMGNK